MTTKRYLTSRDLPYRGKGPNGRGVCRWCGVEVEPPRRSWCSDDCVGEYLSRSSAAPLRNACHARDKGVCALCGCDTEKVRRVFRAAVEAYCRTKAPRMFEKPGYGFALYAAAGLARPVFDLFIGLGWSRSRLQNSDTLWDADHVTPVVEGGGQCGEENVRTLCLPCHKAETKALAARRAKQRRDAKRGLLATATEAK